MYTHKLNKTTNGQLDESKCKQHRKRKRVLTVIRKQTEPVGSQTEQIQLILTYKVRKQIVSPNANT